MASTTQEQLDKDSRDFADQFDAPDLEKTEQTDDEAFGLAPDGDSADAPASESGVAIDPEPTGGQPAVDANEQRLREWEANLKAQQAELDARAASMETTNVAETQTGNAAADDNDAGNKDPADAAEPGAVAPADPAAALAEDFGPEFVTLLTALIEKVCGDKVGAGISGVQATVQEVIEHLQSERHQAHFKTIAAVHADFNDVIESSEFEAWRAGLPENEQADVQRVIDSGSAQEIIDMLTKFKNSASGTDASDDSVDAAEGVRSSGLRLPAPPAQSTDYAAAWNEQ